MGKKKICEICRSRDAQAVFWFSEPWLGSEEHAIGGGLFTVVVCGLCLQMKAERLLKKACDTIDNPEVVWPFDFEADIKGERSDKSIQRQKLTARLRWKILARDEYQCRICGRRGADVPLEVDHIIPVAEGGRTAEANLRTLCRRCNSGKGASDPRTIEP